MTKQEELDILFVRDKRIRGHIFGAASSTDEYAKRRDVRQDIQLTNDEDSNLLRRSTMVSQNITMYPSSVREMHSGMRSEETSMFRVGISRPMGITPRAAVT